MARAEEVIPHPGVLRKRPMRREAGEVQLQRGDGEGGDPPNL